MANINIGVEPKIVHLSFSADINRHFEYMRYIMDECYGKHSLHTFKNYPKADLYITEHFMSTKQEIKAFPYKNKTINVVHSMKCTPPKGVLKNIVHTEFWKRYLHKRKIENLVVIPGGLNLKPYADCYPDYSKKIFGRITRWSPGKIPPWWNELVKDLLDNDEAISCLMFIDVKDKGRSFLRHPRMFYDQSCKITDFKGQYLKKMSVYVHANGTFKEILSNGIIEAMATGLPVIYKDERSLREITGEAGIRVTCKEDLKIMIKELLRSDNMRREYGLLAKKRSQFYDVKKTIIGYDNLIKECLK